MPKKTTAPADALLAKVKEHEARGTLIYFAPPDGYNEEMDGFRISIVRAGGDGHHPTGHWPYEGRPGQKAPYFFGPDIKRASEACDKLNARLGVTPEEAALIIARSITRSAPKPRRPRALDRLSELLGLRPGSLRERGR